METVKIENPNVASLPKHRKGISAALVIVVPDSRPPVLLLRLRQPLQFRRQGPSDRQQHLRHAVSGRIRNPDRHHPAADRAGAGRRTHCRPAQGERKRQSRRLRHPGKGAAPEGRSESHRGALRQAARLGRQYSEIRTGTLPRRRKPQRPHERRKGIHRRKGDSRHHSPRTALHAAESQRHRHDLIARHSSDCWARCSV